MAVATKSKLKHVTRSKPCPICEKPDWCSVSDNGEVVICMRVADGAKKATANGGWLHLTTDPTKPKTGYVAPIKLVATVAKRHEVYSALLERLSLSARHSDHLLNVRHLSEETITRAGFASVPDRKTGDALADEILRSLGNPLYVPGFFREKGQWRLRFSGTRGFYIPLRDKQGRINALQIRLDDHWEGRRYLLVSSDEMQSGASSGAPAHFARPWQVHDAILITEGGLKAEVCAEILQEPVCGLVAVGTFTDRFGWQLRTWFPTLQRVAVAYDQETKPKAMEATERQKERLIKALESAQLDVTVFDWPAEQGKGFDDYLINQRRAA